LEFLIPLAIVVLLAAGTIAAVRRQRKDNGVKAARTQKSLSKPEKKQRLCRECKGTIPEDARRCMHCGSKQPKEVGPLGTTLMIVITIAFVVSIATANNTRNSVPRAEVKTEPPGKSEASVLCMESVRLAAKFPSSVDFSIFDSPPARPIAGGGWAVFLAFESKNGLGNMIPQMAQCDVKDGKLQGFSVQNR